MKELMLATVDNPSNAAEWAMAEMINEPSIMQKAVEEIDRVVGRHRFVLESDLPSLTYVKACVKRHFGYIRWRHSTSLTCPLLMLWWMVTSSPREATCLLVVWGSGETLMCGTSRLNLTLRDI